MATPSLLQLYTRSCEPADFGSLTLILAGAEKLPHNVADAFEQKFRIRPLEGYGCTECSPAVAVNATRLPRVRLQPTGNRSDSIGHLMPGMSLRILDLETGQAPPPGNSGLAVGPGTQCDAGLPSVAGKDRPGASRRLVSNRRPGLADAEGFLRITGRISRMSKIAGEMVPHQVVEAKINELAPVQELRSLSPLFR